MHNAINFYLPSPRYDLKMVHFGPIQKTELCFTRPVIFKDGGVETERVWKPIELISEGDSPRNR